ncbi:MAG: hypothetical protein WBO10_04230 [Pyrinomonadaceae bacterium]
MKTIRTITLSVEKSETMVIRGSCSITRFWCDGCGREARMTGIGNAARLAGTLPRLIYRMLESKNVHFAERNSELLICLNSLIESHLDEGADGPKVVKTGGNYE